MKDTTLFLSSDRLIRREPNPEPTKIKDLRARRVSEFTYLQEGLLEMIGEIMEMIGRLSRCVVSGAQRHMNACESLTKEVDRLEQALTTKLVSLKLKPDMLKSLLRLPHLLKTICDMLRAILQCCRIKAMDGVPFTDKAHAELNQLFAFLYEMMINLGDALETPNDMLLEHIISQSNKVGKMLLDFRAAHWKRLEDEICSPRASLTYLAILDSMAAMNEVLKKMCVTLFSFGTTSHAGEAAFERSP